MGVKEYDWGGIASCDEPNGIDRFKMPFGGRYNEDYKLYAAFFFFTCKSIAKDAKNDE